MRINIFFFCSIYKYYNIKKISLILIIQGYATDKMTLIEIFSCFIKVLFMAILKHEIHPLNIYYIVIFASIDWVIYLCLFLTPYSHDLSNNFGSNVVLSIAQLLLVC